MLLTDLLAETGLDLTVTGNTAVDIRAVTADSRAVTPGALFIALPGVTADGTRYIPDALRGGAAAVLMATHARSDVVSTVPIIKTTDMRAAVSAVAATFFKQQPQYTVAITGTDGKTSTADFTRQLAQHEGSKAASIGTLGLRSPFESLNTAFPKMNTSPEPILLHQTLAQLADHGVTVAAIEASSHGLDQKRLDGVRFTAAAFTNFGRDHLDYHGTLEDYFLAKARLFTHVLQEGKHAVLNRDDARFDTLASMCAARRIHVTSVGTHVQADYRIVQLIPHVGGLRATLAIRGEEYRLDIPLYGGFQLFNMLCAVGMLAAAGFRESALLSHLPALTGVPGRLEKIVEHKGAAIFVDYAHTPAALENILHTLRPHTEGKLHVVFGCGGDRDQGKRPEMGAVAARLADHVMVTDDNPRSENPASIRAAILSAAPQATEIGDRAQAIAVACAQLAPGDVLVVAGKGHETTQTIGKDVLDFNDADHIRKANGQ